MATSEEYEKWAKDNVEYGAGLSDTAAMYHILSAILAATTSVTMKLDKIIELLDGVK